MNPFDKARATQAALDAALHAGDPNDLSRAVESSVFAPIPTGDTVELRGGWASLLWKVESGFDLPPEFADTVPVGGEQ